MWTLKVTPVNDHGDQAGVGEDGAHSLYGRLVRIAMEAHSESSPGPCTFPADSWSGMGESGVTCASMV
jgi:hypothetical protein